MAAEVSTETLVAGTTHGPLTAFTALSGAGVGAAAGAGAMASVGAGATALDGATHTGVVIGEDSITLGTVHTMVVSLASVTLIAEMAMRPITTAEEAIQITAQVVQDIQQTDPILQIEVTIQEEKLGVGLLAERALPIDITT